MLLWIGSWRWSFFSGEVFFSFNLNRLAPILLRQSALAITMFIEVLLFLSASLLLSNTANQEWFIVCMCLALGLQNGALDKTNGVSVHSTYMTGMVTTLMRKSFGNLCSKPSPHEESPRDSARLTIQVLALMWVSFILGAAIGAGIVSSLHHIGLLGIVLPLILLILIEMKPQSPQGQSTPKGTAEYPLFDELTLLPEKYRAVGLKG